MAVRGNGCWLGLFVTDGNSVLVCVNVCVSVVGGLYLTDWKVELRNSGI